MIKQIQLRGISRDPSDRSNSDGGCAESLNVQLNNNELAPCPTPVDVSSTLGVPSSLKVLYIHKQNSYTNYVGSKDSNLCAKIAGTENPVVIHALEGGADPVGITSIGNMLVWNTNYQDAPVTHYAIFRDGAYTYLGTSVPEPTVTFTTTAGTATTVDFSIPLSDAGGASWLSYNATNTWNGVIANKGVGNTDDEKKADVFYDAFYSALWKQVNAKRVALRGNKEFAAPVMARYAMRLYDGSYIYVSAPVILTGSTWHEHFEVIANCISTVFVGRLTFKNNYTASVRVDFGEAGLWKDYVEAVDIFISTDILIPHIDAQIGQAYDTGSHTIHPEFTAASNDCGFEFDGVSDYAWLNAQTTANRFKEDFETEMTNKGNFYRIASIPAFTQSYWTEDLVPKSQDDLVVLPRLSEGDAHQISGLGGLTSYNNRLVLSGEKVTLSRGNQRPDALLPVGSYTGSTKFTVFFYIRTPDGGTKISQGYSAFDAISPERVRAYITYPDPSCYKAVLYMHLVSGYSQYELPMKEHPRINAAYGFWGLGDTLGNNTGGRSYHSVLSITETEDRTYTVENRLFLSEMNNPFSYPLGQRVSFTSKIIASLPITTPLSTGQFGQFQLYVFTKEGIWAETITDEGKIGASHPVTRDAAFDGAVGQLDQGIVFASKSGVMLLSGSQVTNLSPNMTSERDILGIGSASLSNLGDWTALMTVALDTIPFLKFIEQARFVYDYPGKRILLFRSDKNYAWVYKLDTATWHKQMLPASKTFAQGLNSYPDALVTMMSSGAASIVDFTTLFGTNTYPLTTALVATRDLSFDAPDIRKEIKALKIRGAYRMGGSTKVIVLASMDGEYYKQLTSLHNGSYKFYKLILLAKLYPDERISWVDADVETRFTNKLR